VNLVSVDPNNPPWIANTAVGLLGSQNGRSFTLSKVLYYGTQVVAGTNHFLVLQLRDNASGQDSIWDVKVYQDLENRIQLTSASPVNKGIVSPDPPSIDPNKPGDNQGYRRPNWVVTKPVPGGISPRDANSPEARLGAQTAISMLSSNNQGFQGATLESVLHYGTQATADPVSYYVVRIIDQNGQRRVWELKLTRRQNGSSSATATSLN
jgi:hypothetical protein